ncbi:CARDB domain-containing protein [Elongatibacter sediminis]|uniref:CARDB domain-containing protein n=1 Tax=Elongatibacter sediminis TaxID=3119006 RepID=A0AAW9RNY0_9GAMM
MSIQPVAVQGPEGTVIEFEITLLREDWSEADEASLERCLNIGIDATFVARFALDRVDGSAQFGLSATSRDMHLAYKGVPKGDLSVLWCGVGPSGSRRTDNFTTLHLHEDDLDELNENATLYFSKVDLDGTKTRLETIRVNISDFDGPINENECSSMPITAETPLTGTLSESDCDDSLRGSRYLTDIYTYEGSRGETLPVHVEWSGVDGFVYLEAPDGSIEARNDNFSGETDSHIEGPLLQTGTYRIWLTTKEEGATGGYEISLKSSEKDPEGDWSMSSVIVSPTELASNDELSIFALGEKNGNFTLIGAGQVDVVYLLSEDDDISESDFTLGSSSHCCASEFEGVWQGVLDVEPGTYWVGACITEEDVDASNNCSSGTRITVDASAACSSSVLACGQTLSGALDAGSCTAGPLGPEFATERFTFSGEAGETVWLNGDWAFDGYLLLEDPSGNIVGENDNYLGSTDSRIEHTLDQGGVYSVWATSYEPGASGAFDLTLECTPPGGPDLQVDTPDVGATILSPGQAFEVSTRLHNAGTRASDSTTLRYRLSPDSRIQSSDPEIGTEGAPNMLSATSAILDRSLIAPITPGTYWLGVCADAVADEAATSNNCSTARQIVIRPQPACVSHAVTCGSAVSGNLSNQDCALSPRGPGFPGEVLEVQAEAGESLVWDAQWSGFDGYLVLENPDGTVVAANDDAESPLRSRIEYAVAEGGTHRLWVGGLERGAAGGFEVELICGAASEPDLVASPVSAASENVGVKDGITLSAQIRNAGGSAAPAGRVHFVVSPDAAISVDDTIVASVDLGPIDAGASLGTEVSAVAPSVAGHYWVGICADAANGETLVANNCSASDPAGTRLTVSADSSCTSSTMSCGQHRPGALGPGNCDQGPAGAGHAADVYSFTGSAGDGVSLVAEWTGVDGYLYLEAPDGSIVAENDDFQGPSHSRIEHVLQQSGSHRVWLSAYTPDEAGSYDLDFGCDDVAGPDLRVESADLDTTRARPGQVVTVEAEVLNQGKETSGESTLQFILSDSPDLPASHRILGQADVLALQPGVTSGESMAFATDVQPGTYWLTACVNPDPLEVETGNNCTLAGALTVESNDRPIDITPYLNDAWYNPETGGQGFFINVLPVEDQMFVSWFTFDTERPADDVPYELGDPGHRWLVALGAFERGVAELNIYLNEGGVFDQSPPAPTESLYGSMTVTFADCNTGWIDFDLPEVNRQGTIPITRVATDNLETCQAHYGVADSSADEASSTAAEIPADSGGDLMVDAALNDAWFNPATGGQGFSFNVFPELGSVFMSWFTYDTEAAPEDTPHQLGAPGLRWLTAVGKLEGKRANLTLYRTSGGVFNSASPAPVEDVYGTVEVRFDDCRTGELNYDIPSLDRQGVVPIQRLVPDNIPGCERSQLQRAEEWLTASPPNKSVLDNFCDGTAAWQFDWPDVPAATGYTVELWRHDDIRPRSYRVSQSDFHYEKAAAVPDTHRTGWKWRYRAEHAATGLVEPFSPFFTFDVAPCNP